jgi:hypothetical protein
LGADEKVSLMSWQLITAIHDEGDGPTHEIMTALMYACSVIIGFAGTDRRLTFNVLLWSFLCNLIDIHQGFLSSTSGLMYSYHSMCVETLIVLHNKFTQSHFLL